jgi:hypothetical protein
LAAANQREGGFAARAHYSYCAARSAALCHFLQIFAKIRSSVVVKPHQNQKSSGNIGGFFDEISSKLYYKDTLIMKEYKREIVGIKNEQLENKENRETFFKRLENKFSKEEIEDIDFAYDIAKEAHRTALRDEGMRYFEHPRSGCLIMTDELGLYDRDLLISFLLHDVGEDTPMLGNITKSYDEFKKKAYFRLNKLFGEKVADTVIRLTKPSIDNVKFNTQKEVYNFYSEELKKSEDAILLKMVDRLHNLRSLTPNINKPRKIELQIEETKSKYLPIFKSVIGKRKEYAEILVSKIKEQLFILESKQNIK